MQRQKYQTRSLSNNEDFVDALVTSSFVTMAIISRIGAQNDLSLSLIRVLGILWDRRLKMTELADYLGLEKQTMSGLIARAEKRGLLKRAPNETDGRATDVFLTNEGRKLTKLLRVQILHTLDPFMETLSEKEKQTLQGVLLRLRTELLEMVC